MAAAERQDAQTRRVGYSAQAEKLENLRRVQHLFKGICLTCKYLMFDFTVVASGLDE